MLDWQGLLKFTLKHSDGTKKTQFKQMSEQNKKFLQGALNEYCNSQIQQIKNILIELDKPQDNNQQQRLTLLQDLQQLLDSLDKGNALYTMNGHIVLLKIIFYSKYESNKIVALQIFSSANQNDASVQNDSINTGALQLTKVIKTEISMKLKQNMMSAISAMIRGQNLDAKRIFIQIQGLELLKYLSQNKPSQRLMNKINNLWRDLQYYDQFLHQTYKDLSKFSNTTGLKMDAKNCDLQYDVNEEYKQKNFKPENEKYKGCIKQFLNNNKEIKQNYDIWLKKQEQQ